MNDASHGDGTKHVAWLTDLHLNFLTSPQIDAFYETVSAREPDVVLVGGDIGDASTFVSSLGALETKLQLPIYFVLGNHDFYGSSIADGRRTAAQLAERSRWLSWLPDAGVVELAPGTGLVGHGAWADGRLGKAAQSLVMLNDYVWIQDFVALNLQERFAKLNELGDEAARYFESVLPRALERYEHVIVLTHVPPFKDACWHQGKISDEDWLPHFCCSVVGDVLIALMREHSARRLSVLCGHTHGVGEAEILPNLTVRTGGAVYRKPSVQAVFEV